MRWAAALAAWAIPSSITGQVADSPWVLPRQVFIRRAETQVAQASKLGMPARVLCGRCLELATEEVSSALLSLGMDPASPLDLGSSGRELVTLTWDVEIRPDRSSFC